MALELLPLALALALVALVALAPVSRAVDRALTRLAYVLFRGWQVRPNRRRERLLRSAGIGTPYRVYVTKTWLYAVVAALAGSVVGVYTAAAVLASLPLTAVTFPGAETLDALPAILRSDDVKRFTVYLFSAVSVGGLAASVVNALRWQLPTMRASTRRRQIDASLPRMVAFVYALSRGGMAFPDVMRAVADNRNVFGTGAEEFATGVRDLELFSADVVTTVRGVSQRTPSEQLQRFTENLTNVLQSGRNLSAFLHEQYERYRERAEEQQREILDLLAATAEVYVTVVVAGMLFLITILLVIGLTSGGTLALVQLLTYLVLPAVNLAFVAYLAEVTQPLRVTRERDPDPGYAEAATLVTGDATHRPLADGGVAAGTPRSRANVERLRVHRRLRAVRASLRSPFEAVVDAPERLLLVTVPLALGFVLWQLPAAFDGGGFDLAAVDDALVQAALFVLATFAAVHELHQRRLRRLEESIPDLLDRLASLNEAGVSVVSSFDRVRRTDVGTLGAEVEHVWRDIQWGATVEQALSRFERRIETPAVTRTVTLITSAMRASNDIGPVLRIAAEQARADRRLRRQRRQEMFTYLIVIYVAFVVFLVVIVTIDAVLVPNLPSADAVTGATRAGTVSTLSVVGVSEAEIQQYRLVFFHTALVQSVLSGFVGGQMAGASTRDGAKHATVMLAVTYAVFLLH